MCFFPVMNARVKLTVKVNLVYYANWNVAGPTTKTGWAKHEASVTAVNKTRLKGADRLSQCAIDRRTGTRTSPVEKIWRDGDRKLNTLELITAFGQLDFTSSVFCYSDVTYTEFTETVRSLLHAHTHTYTQRRFYVTRYLDRQTQKRTTAAVAGETTDQTDIGLFHSKHETFWSR